jgi:protein phosphatase
MSRFAANPKWLIYLPPTMSPSETSKREGLLEYPDEAFSYFRHEGIGRVICEQKHMGSRAVVIICKDAEAATKRFGVVDEGIGICYTRTGRRFFNDRQLEAEFLARVQNAISTAGIWEELKTDWICLRPQELLLALHCRTLLLPWKLQHRVMRILRSSRLWFATVSALRWRKNM